MLRIFDPQSPPPSRSPDADVAEAVRKWGLSYHAGKVVECVVRARDAAARDDLITARWHLAQEIARLEGQDDHASTLPAGSD